MCKIAGTTGFNPKKLETIVNETWEEMSTTEDDGFGAAWTDTVGGVSWVKTSIPFFPESDGLMFPEFCRAFGDASIKGEPDGNFLLIHGRTATCAVDVDNTHPMLEVGRRRKLALIHNGMVDSFTYKNESTSCDSELLMRAYQKDGFKGIENGIEGYYALMLIDKTKARTQFVVARDDTAKLEVGRMPCGSWCFGTTRSLIETMGADHYCGFKGNTYSVFTLGEPKPKVRSFKPTPRSWAGTSKALGGYGGSSPYGSAGTSLEDEEASYYETAGYGSYKGTSKTYHGNTANKKSYTPPTNKPAGVWASGQKIGSGPNPKGISNVVALDKELEERKKLREATLAADAARLLLRNTEDK